MISTWLPQRRQSSASLPTAASSVPGGGVRMHQRPSNSSAKPASGPECSVPATGWPGTKCTPVGQQRAEIADHRLLHRADIGDDGAGLQVRRDGRRRPRHRRRAACRRSTRSASVDRRAGVGRGCCRTSLSSTALSRVRLAAGAWPTISPARPLAPHGAGERRADQADADQRDALEQRLSRPCVSALPRGRRRRAARRNRRSAWPPPASRRRGRW